MNRNFRDLTYMVVAISTGVGIYFLFRALYHAEAQQPFAQETTLVFLGAVVTIALTAALLNRQTELELHKEGRVIILQQQFDIYMACIEKVAEIVEHVRHDEELIDELRVLNHKLAMIGSNEVVTRFEAVLNSLLAGLADGALSEADGEQVMALVADLTIAMRSDFLESTTSSSRQAAQVILRNAKRMEQLDDFSFTTEHTGKGGKK